MASGQFAANLAAQQLNANAQAQGSQRYGYGGLSGLSGLGGLPGSVGQGFFGEPGSDPLRNYQQFPPRPTVAYVSKVTPKPGYIVRGGLTEFGVVKWMRVEAKTWTDYKWYERIIIWFQT